MGDWETFTPEQWNEAAHGPNSFFKELNEATCAFILEMGQKYCKDEPKYCKKATSSTADTTDTSDSADSYHEGPLSLTEVGCGTGEMLLPLVGAGTPFKHVIGVDINPQFIEHCKKELKTLEEEKGEAGVATNVHHVVGDVLELGEVMRDTMAKANVDDFMEGRRVVSCVGNTIGIMPEDIGGVNIRARCYTEMANLAGSNGVAVMVYWNARRFPDALKDFYGKHPELCGSLEGAAIKLPEEDPDGLHAGMTTKSGYSTKWTSLKGVEKIFQGRPELEVLEAMEIGNNKGVAVAFRSRC